ncbi:prion-inhibition and propagation, helo domain-containing protein [Dactylonectria estremocensis]|uniref:Prion-inhibition and propagation, helo domain-containing protein n=1 Tax=Dactylonectria estremocensis TaxID=1079267 RepID=A0A9P9D5H9_9HYPO|nr:prion-inhibition and propagation, helo domain-containing protein [Dactylonectria estremocensis]
MEPVGLAVGIAGLAGLFSSCLEAVEKVQSYRSFGADSQVLDTQFKAEKLRFEQWGRHVGFDRGTPSADHHQALDDPDISSAVRDLLLIIDNICNANGASRRPLLARTGLAQDELFRARQAQPSRTAPSESRRRKLAWALGGRGERTEQVNLLGKVVQQLHNLVPPDSAKATRPVHEPNSGGTDALVPLQGTDANLDLLPFVVLF